MVANRLLHIKAVYYFDCITTTRDDPAVISKRDITLVSSSLFNWFHVFSTWRSLLVNI